MESVGLGAAVSKNIENLLKNLEASEMEFFAKGYEKCMILSEFLETQIINLDDYACPKVQYLIFKDEEYHLRCCSYPFRHAKLFTVQKEKNLHTERGQKRK